MKCDNCQRDIEPGEPLFTEKWYVCKVSSTGDSYALTDGPFVGFYCKEHVPGHILRASKGITAIPGASHLGARGK